MIKRNNNGKIDNSIRGVATRTYVENIYLTLKENLLNAVLESILQVGKGVAYLFLLPFLPIVLIFFSLKSTIKNRRYMNREYPEGWRKK